MNRYWQNKKYANLNQVKAIHTLLTKLGVEEEEYRQLLDGYGVTTSKKLSFGQAGEVITNLSKLVRVNEAAKQTIPEPSKIKKYGTGERGNLTKDNLTSEQAERIEIFAKLMNWDNTRIDQFIKRQTGAFRAVQMLMNYQATKVITGMTKVFAGTSRRNFLELNNSTNRQLKDLYERLQRNKTEMRANNG